MADPAPGAPLEWIQAEHHRRVASELRAAATELRREVAAVAEVLRRLPAHDRPDVWEGRAADAAREERTELIRRLTSPHTGALTGTLDAARRLEARAEAHDDATITPPPSPATTGDLLELMRDRWRPPGRPAS